MPQEPAPIDPAGQQIVDQRILDRAQPGANAVDAAVTHWRQIALSVIQFTVMSGLPPATGPWRM
jgi:hypothetical protein